MSVDQRTIQYDVVKHGVTSFMLAVLTSLKSRKENGYTQCVWAKELDPYSLFHILKKHIVPLLETEGYKVEETENVYVIHLEKYEVVCSESSKHVEISS